MKQFSVLVVEDDSINLEAAVAIFGLTGWNVLAASHADEGIRIAISEQPDVILVKHDMAGRIGRHDATARIPVIAFTAQDWAA